MFEALCKSVVGIITTPVAVVADVVTLGGQFSERDEPYTATTLKAVVAPVEKLLD